MSPKRVFLLTALPSVVLLAALTYFGYELSETRKENRELLQQLLQVRQQVGGNREGQEAYIKAVNGDALDYFGDMVSIDNGTLAVGVEREDSNQNTITNGTGASSNNDNQASGAVYVYSFYEK